MESKGAGLVARRRPSAGLQFVSVSALMPHASPAAGSLDTTVSCSWLCLSLPLPPDALPLAALPLAPRPLPPFCCRLFLDRRSACSLPRRMMFAPVVCAASRAAASARSSAAVSSSLADWAAGWPWVAAPSLSARGKERLGGR